MAFIKRFESASIDEDIESCKDIIETLVEYESDIVATNYNIGYYRSHRTPAVSHNMTSEEDKKAVEFNLFFKGFDGIKSKSDIDKYINLIQRSKSLYSKFENYCKSIIISMEEDYIHFILTFEESDNLKLNAKIKNIYKSISEQFADYNRYKTIPLLNYNNENSELKEIINRQINKKEVSGTFRFSLSLDIKENLILISPNNFKFKGYAMEKWIKIKSSDELMKIVLGKVHLQTSNTYYVDRYKSSIGILIKSDHLEIKVNL